MTFPKIQILLEKINEGTKSRTIRMNSILIDGKWPKKSTTHLQLKCHIEYDFFYSVISANPNVTEENWKVHREGHRYGDREYRFSCVVLQFSEIFNALVFSIGIERGVICQLMNRNSYIVKNHRTLVLLVQHFFHVLCLKFVICLGNMSVWIPFFV